LKFYGKHFYYIAIIEIAIREEINFGLIVSVNHVIKGEIIEALIEESFFDNE
jgi:hypothetical protein